jgi:hypothetical protein
MSDYQEVIQNPERCFTDSQLKTGKPTLNALGLPQPVTGGFCSVYQLANGKSRWAVRCFLHNIKDLRDRYHEISRYLKSKRLKQMVGFEYVPEGIRVRTHWHPVLKMEWVDGDTLNMWVGKHLKDPKALRRLAGQWVQLMEELEREKIGHCDLQHGNILVDGSGNLKLIDYDGMYVPPLRGRGSHEKGHPAFQHPQREGRDFDESVDRFSALVIYTSLVALAESKDLWGRYYEEDNLIFRRADFMSPDSAAVFKELEKMGGEVADYSAALREACKHKLRDSPRLRDVKVGKGKTPAASSSRSAAPNPQPSVAAAASPAKSSQPVPAPKAPAGGARVIPMPTTTPAAASFGRKSTSRRATSRRAAQTPAASKTPGTAPAAARSVTPAAAPARSTTPAASPAPARSTTPAAATAVAAKSAPAPAPRPAPPPPPKPALKAVPPPAPKPAPRAAPAPAPKPALKVVTPAAVSAGGWALEWARPGKATEKHVWKVPVYGTREAPRRFLGMTLGTRREKFVESYDDKIEERQSFVRGHNAAVTSLAFSHDGKLLASGSRDRTVRVWSLQNGRETCAPLEARAGAVAVAFVPERPVVAAVLDNRRLVLWDYGLHRQVVQIDSPDRSPLRAIAVSRDGKWIAAGGGRSIHVWQTEHVKPTDQFRSVDGRVESLAFTPDGTGLLCGTHNGRLQHFERGKPDPLWVVRTGLPRITGLSAPVRSGSVVGGGADGSVAFWDLNDGSEKQRLRPMRGHLASLAVAPDGALVLVGLASGKAFLSETGKDPEVALLDGHRGAVTAAALPGAAKLAATGAVDGSVRLWVAP